MAVSPWSMKPAAMIRLFHCFILRDLKRNLIRSLLTVAGIALGVSVLLAISMANNTVIGQFRQSVDLVSGKANLEIWPATTPGIDDKVLSKIEWLRMVGGKYTPILETTAVFPDSIGEPVRLLGIDVLADSDFKNYGKLSNSVSIPAAGDVWIGAKLAKKHNLSKEQKFKVLINDHAQSLKVSEILSSEGVRGIATANLIVADIGFVKRACSMPSQLSQIEIIAPGDRVDKIKAKLSEELPLTLRVIHPEQRGVEVENMTRSFECNLLALSFVALMVGMFLIYNTMSITVLRRRQEIGILRALGVSRKLIFAMFGIEVICFGTIGSVLGIVLGLALANGALGAVSKTVEYFYYQEPLETVCVSAPLMVGVFLGAIFLTFLAALPSLLEAIAVLPGAAIRRGSEEVKFSGHINSLACLGLVFFGLAYLASRQSPIANFPIFGYVAALLSILGSAFILPLALKKILPWLAFLAGRWHDVGAKLAILSLYGTLGRTSVAVASLAIGIAMMVSLAIMINSFRTTVTTWIDQTLKADLWVESKARASGSYRARMSEDIAKNIGKIRGVAAVDGFVETPINFEGERTNLAAGDVDVIKKFGHMHFTSHESNAAVLSRLDDEGALVSEPFASRRNLKSGDQLTLQTSAGPLHLTIQGIYYNYASDLGYIVIARTLYKKAFADSTISNCAVYLTEGADPQAVQSAITSHFAGKEMLSIRTTKDLREEAIRIFNRTFSITYALHTIAITVALLAVMNALFALTIESRRQFALLKYLGAQGKQIRRVILVEAALLGIFGNVVGLLLGFVLSFLLIFVINKQSFGWTVDIAIPYEFLWQSSILIFLTAILAGIIPARLAVRTLAPSLVREE